MLVARRLARPILAAGFRLPTSRRIDAPLIGCAVLIEIGWALSGVCPGPPLANLSSGALQVLLCVADMATHGLLLPAFEE